MPTGFNPPLLFLRAYDHEGIPAPGAKLYHRVAGTELPKAIYYDPGLTSECPQPLVADAEGRFPQFFLEGGAYRFVLFDANDVQLRPPEDPIWGANGGSIFPTPTNSGFLYYDVDTDTYSWIQVEGAKVKVDADDPVAGYLSEKLTDSDTVHWEILPDHSGIQAVVQEGAGDTYKVKVNADDTTPGFLEAKLADTTDTQFTPTEDGSQLDNIVYQLTGLGTRLNRVKNAGFDFDRGPFPVASAAGGRGISFGRRFVAGVEVDTWAAQGNNGKIYWTSNNDASRWKVSTEDDSVYTAYPSARAYYGWSCIQFVYVAGTHNCFCWVMGSGDLPQTIIFVEHKAENYNADGTFKTSALNSVTYSPTAGPYSAIDIMQVDTTGGIFISGDDTKVGYTTDLATFTVALTAEHNVGGFGFDGETTVQIIERDSGVIWRSTNYGMPGTFSKVTSFYLDDVLTTHFPTDNAAQWGSMFSMYGQWLSINFHYVSGGIGFIYSDDGIYWYSSRDEATQFYDANNDGLRWFATNAVPNSGTPIFQLIVSMIPVHRRLSMEKGAVVSGQLILRDLVNAPVIGTDNRGRLINKPANLSGLSDVAVSSPSSGQILSWDGAKWVNANQSTDGGGITNSPGTQWYRGQLNPNYQWFAVAYSTHYKKFVAVGDGPFVAISSDGGDSWSYSPVPISQYYAIAFNGARCVIIDQASVAQVSDDLISWNAFACGIAASSLIYDQANSVFVAVSDIGATRCSTSSDGQVWTARIVPVREWRKVSFGNRRLIAVAKDIAVNSVIYSDDGGATWTTVAIPVPYGLGSVSYNPVFDTWVCCVTFGPSVGNFIVSSDNGITWELVGSGTAVLYFSTICTPSGRFLAGAVGGNPVYWFFALSDNGGYSWSPIASLPGSTARDIAYDDEHKTLCTVDNTTTPPTSRNMFSIF